MNIFIIETPLQLINAVEAKHHFSLETDCTLIILDDQSGNNFQQIESIIDRNDWKNIAIIANKNTLTSHILALRQLNRFIKIHCDSFSRLFIGEYRAKLMRHLANLPAFSEVYLLDDGTATHKIAEYRLLYLQGKTPHKYQRGLKKYINKRRLLGLRDQDLEKIHFFTVFNIPHQLPDQVTLHNYNYHRSLTQSFSTLEHSFFIGCPIMEMNIVSHQNYFRYLKTIASLHTGKILYIPHRRENTEKLEEISHITGWECKTLGMPVELYMLKNRLTPINVLGLYSTALDNCQIIFGDQLPITAYRIPKEDIAKKEWQDFTDTIYDYYRKNYQSEIFKIDNL